jgi:hypothetical protein
VALEGHPGANKQIILTRKIDGQTRIHHDHLVEILLRRSPLGVPHGVFLAE